jgi:tetratricopeptide (TPR) repeat protein
MIVRVLFLVLFFSSLSLYAQKSNSTDPGLSFQPTPQSNEDELAKHLSAAETYQISGDLANAAVANRAIIAVALHRLGNVAVEEGKFQDAVKLLTESKLYNDNVKTRVNLAIAHLRLNENDKAQEEAQAAVSLDPKFARARYILGNIYFNKGDYKAALPELEKVFVLTPDFDVARALGLTYLHLRQLERAKLLFEEIQAALKKENAALHILFGQAFEETDYPLEAEREFKRALTIDPKAPRASFFLGYVILQHGGSERLSEAGQAFEKELQLNPNDFYANFFAGVVASSENDHAKAIRFLQKAIQFNSKSSEAHLFLGQSQLEQNDLPEAEKNLRRAIELAKDDAKSDYPSRRMHFLLGRLLIKTKRQEEGEKELVKARQIQEKLLKSARDEINQILGQVVGETKVAAGANAAQISGEQKQFLTPERTAELKKLKLYLSDILAQAFHNLGVIAAQNGDLSESVEKFAAAAVWKADFPGLDRNWGIIGFRAKQFEKAIAPLSRHVKANPQDKLTRQMLGASYYFTNNFKQTVETLKPIEAVLVGEPELAYFYGISLIQLERNTDAAPVFSRLAAASQKNAEALAYAAQGFMISGDYQRAIKEFRAVTALAPQMPKINFFIGQSLIRLNRFDEAEKVFRQELQINPADESSKYHLAFTMIERKINPDEAVSLLKEAIDLRPDYPEAHYQLGKIHNERNEIEKAIEHLEAAIRSDQTKDYIYYQLSIAYRRASRKEDADRALKTYQDLKAAGRKTETPSLMGNKKNVP